MTIPVSALILTLNEAVNLPDCLDALTWCDDIVVLDSGSRDATQSIASEKGARVFERPFDNYAAQRNFGLKEIPYRHPWILMVDADERWPVAIASEIQATLAVDPDCTLGYFLRKDIFMGRWLRRSSGYPTWAGRLVKPDQVRVEREINEEYLSEGNHRYLKEHFLHYPFNKGIAYWFERHNRYSSMEAETLMMEVQSRMPWKNLFSQTPTVRRKALKQLAYRLPGRPFLVFMYLYWVRMGFLDGLPGLLYARMRRMYEEMIDLKIKELRRRTDNLPV